MVDDPVRDAARIAILAALCNVDPWVAGQGPWYSFGSSVAKMALSDDDPAAMQSLILVAKPVRVIARNTERGISFFYKSIESKSKEHDLFVSVRGDRLFAVPSLLGANPALTFVYCSSLSESFVTSLDAAEVWYQQYDVAADWSAFVVDEDREGDRVAALRSAARRLGAAAILHFAAPRNRGEIVGEVWER